MKLKSLIAAVALTVSSFGAFAGTVFVDDSVTFEGVVTGNKNSSFTQSFSFTGLASGIYDVLGTISGPTVNFSSITLSGAAWTNTTSGSKYKFGEITFTGASPFTLIVSGTKLNAGPAAAGFSGTLSVSPVPEPETYAMMMAGLGLLGFMAKRKKSA